MGGVWAQRLYSLFFPALDQPTFQSSEFLCWTTVQCSISERYLCSRVVSGHAKTQESTNSVFIFICDIVSENDPIVLHEDPHEMIVLQYIYSKSARPTPMRVSFTNEEAAVKDSRLIMHPEWED